MTTHAMFSTVAAPAAALCLALGLAACGDDGSATGGTGTGVDTDATTTAAGTDSGEPSPPETGEELCDAGHEAWVKRAIPLLQGRKPASIREVRLLVSMIEQIEAQGGDGRAVVAAGLADGALYRERWATFFFDALRVNRIDERRNVGCYDTLTAAADSPDLAAFVRDNDPASDFGADWTMADLVRSALRLDDLSPLYRADLFARMARPLNGANVTIEELEIMRRGNYGETFDAAYLGRKVGCLECHNSAESVTWDPDPEKNRFWAIPALLEKAVYGDNKGRPEEEVYAVFRYAGFADGNTGAAPWGIFSACGRFDTGHGGDVLGDPAYLAGPLPAGAHVYDLDPKLKAGFDALASNGLETDANLEVTDPNVALAYLVAMNVANQVWQEAMGHPLTVAHHFPRNEAQRTILESLANTFAGNRYSLRSLLSAIVLHPYFNQDAPDQCDASTAYPLAPVFDPFSISSADPNERGNGVGDMVHRYSAWVLIDSAMQALWYDRPERFGSGQFGAPMNLKFLRSMGVFLKDADPGSNGVSFANLLHWENLLARADDPLLGGDCTGPLTGPCAYDWIGELVATAVATPGATVRDLAVAIKDRLITEPTIAGSAEEDALEAAMLLTDGALDALVSDVGASDAEIAARSLAGVLLNTPQFLLAGVPSRDQDPDADPILVVPGTDTKSLCEALAPQVLGAGWSYTCDDAGVTVTKN